MNAIEAFADAFFASGLSLPQVERLLVESALKRDPSSAGAAMLLGVGVHTVRRKARLIAEKRDVLNRREANEIARDFLRQPIDSHLSPGEQVDRKRIRHIWAGMLRRCFDQESDSYFRYGGRGIKVCDEWIAGAGKFIAWSLNNGYAPSLEIDRRDPGGDYSPANCRWVTRSQNQANKRKHRLSRRPCSSKFKGVYVRSKGSQAGRISAQIRKGRTLISLGDYSTEEDAARAYDRAALEHFGEFARLNFPQQQVSGVGSS